MRAEGQRGRSGPVMVRVLPVPDEEHCSVAFAIGRRTGTAVVRNRIRRRLRAALDELARTDAVPHGAVLISGGAPVATAPFPRVRSDLERALARASAS